MSGVNDGAASHLTIFCMVPDGSCNPLMHRCCSLESNLKATDLMMSYPF